jgi:DNA polymerase-1
MLLQVLRRESPDRSAVAFDVGKVFRHEEYAGYKANRSPMPDDLQAQMGRVREVVERFGFPLYEAKGYEADDVIGSLSRRLEAEGHDVVIVTGDSDLLQLVTDRVSVATPARGKFSDVRMYDPAEVRERYGFEPRFVPDYKALVGDTSDNIPGVPGIGDKTARSLVQAYGGVEAILERLDEVKPERARKALEANADQLVRSKRLATVVTDLEVDLAKLFAAASSYERDEVAQLFRELEFRSLLTRLPSATSSPEDDGDEPTPGPHQPAAATECATLRTPGELRNWVALHKEAPALAFDTETDRKAAVGADLVGVSLSAQEGSACYVPLAHDELEADREGLLAELGPLLGPDGPPKVGHNAKFDLMVLRQHGVEVAPIGSDTSIAAFLMNETSVGLKELAATRLGADMTPIEALIGRGKSQRSMAQVPVAEAAPYACADADMTLRLHAWYEPRLKERGQDRLLSELELPLVPVLADMELAGISIDSEALGQLSRELYGQLQQLDQEVKELAGYEFNLKSPQQLSKLLFQDLGLKGGRKTATGYSTDVHALEALQGQHPIIERIVSYRQLSKLKDTYVDALPLLVNPTTGRVHTSFSQTSASTGRLASSDPNLQNIPVRTPLGLKVRRAFIASDSPRNAIIDAPTTLLSADYSQIELRVLAHLTGEPMLVEAFSRDEDVHALTASQLYDTPLDEVTSEMRRTGKTINFGIIYGMSGFRLARDTGLSQRKAADFVKRYNEQFPRIRALFEGTLRRAEETGYVETALGRRRVLPDLHSSNPQRREAARRAAVNMPIQGMAADIIKLAMIKVFQSLRERGIRTRMLLQVHDELVFEAPESELAEAARLVADGMNSAVDLSVPLKVEAEAGRSWGAMSPLDLSASAG